MNVQNNDIWHQWALIIMYDIPSLTDSTLLTADMILVCTKELYLVHDSHFPFCKKLCILLLVRCHHPLIWPPALPLNLTYKWACPLQTSSIPCPKFHVHVPRLVYMFRNMLIFFTGRHC
jgi:hypothetical protein